MNRLLSLLVALASAGTFAGCAIVSPPPKLDDEPPTAPMPAPQRGQAGGVFNGAMGLGFTADQRANRPGDVLTVILQETTQASKSADTSYGKSSGVGIATPVIAGKPIKLDASVSADRNFKGEASSTQKNALAGSITVVVQEVLPNGLLRIKGDRALTLNQGDEVMRLSGYVRATDVDQQNRVSSQRIANARIAYAGHGALADTNDAGWLTRFFSSPLFPF
ncbi:MAG TPA: flagellar basal body L-ring protein FlgH [Rhizobacter sp.]|nr:flagellar basal body L-ring protein FlgH [Rhizobacter sp.]